MTSKANRGGTNNASTTSSREIRRVKSLSGNGAASRVLPFKKQNVSEGDFIWIHVEGREPFCIVQVRKIVRTAGEVRVEIEWVYLPQELPLHLYEYDFREDECILSNHTQRLDLETFAGFACVVFNMPHTVTKDLFFARFRFDFTEKKLLAIDHLNRPVSLMDLKSSTICNNFPNDTNQHSESEIEAHLTSLNTLLMNRGAETALAIHLLHRQWNIQSDEAVFGIRHKDRFPKWATKPVAIADIPRQDLRGYNFCVSPSGLTPYEFRQRRSNVAVDPDFVDEFVAYIRSWRLENVLGLQVKSDDAKELTEVLHTPCNAILHTKDVSGGCECIPTGRIANEVEFKAPVARMF